MINELLLNAIRANNIESVGLILNSENDVNAIDQNKKTALMIAAELGRKEVVEILLKKGANVSAEDKDGKTAYDLATDETVKNILQAVKNHSKPAANSSSASQPSAPQENLGASLLQAVRKNDVNAVKSLLERKVDADTRDALGYTALMYAEHTEIVQLLIKHGADVNATFDYNQIKQSVLMIASERGRADIIEILAHAGANIAFRDLDNSTPLMYARNKESVDLLVSLGVDVNATKLHRKITALMVASRNGNADAVQALVDHGANIDAKSNIGKTALMSAISANGTNDQEVIKTLIAAGANIDLQDAQGNTALMIATKSNKIKYIKILLENGANTTTKNNHGETASDLTQVKNIKNLIDASRKSSAKAKKNNSTNNDDAIRPVVITKRSNAWLSETKRANGNVSSTTPQDEQRTRIKRANRSQDAVFSGTEGANNATEYQQLGKSLLEAVRKNDAADVESLLDRQADVNFANEEGMTSLMFAIILHDDDKIVRILIKHGANIAMQDNAGLTALEIATKNDKKAIKALLENARANQKHSWVGKSSNASQEHREIASILARLSGTSPSKENEPGRGF